MTAHPHIDPDKLDLILRRASLRCGTFAAMPGFWPAMCQEVWDLAFVDGLLDGDAHSKGRLVATSMPSGIRAVLVWRDEGDERRFEN
jgi:hypothetical protein